MAIKKYVSRVSVLVSTLVALSAVLAFVASGKDTSEVVILYTNNTNGDLKHCGCPGNPHGGLAVRMAEIDRARKSGVPTLLLDGGDVFPLPIDDDLKLSYALRMIEKMRYDGVALGDQDFGRGFEETKKFVRSGRFPYLASNLFDLETKELVASQGWLRKVVGGSACLVIGVVAPSAYQFLPGEILDRLEIRDPAETVKGILATERRPNDLVVILSHMGVEEDKKLAQSVKGIHVIVGGHSQTKLSQPIKVNETLIVQAGKYSNYVGELRVAWSKGRVERFQNELVSLGDHMAGSPELEALQREYEATLKQVNVWSGDLGKPFHAERCQTCHEEAYRVWAGSRHAHALESIHHDARARTKDCLFCHTTVIQESLVRDHKEIPMKVVSDVQCLECHKVEFEKDAAVHKLPVAKVGQGFASTKDFCMKCHTPKDSPAFIFETYWKKIQHGAPR